MHLRSIDLQNFRRFERFEAGFDPHFTLLMGGNGAGKTSILQALWCGLHYLFVSCDIAPPVIEETDVFQTENLDVSDELWRKKNFPCVVDLTLDALWVNAPRLVLGMQRRVFGRPESSDRSLNSWDLAGVANLPLTWFRIGNSNPIPLFAHFEAEKPQGTDAPELIAKPFEKKQDIFAIGHQRGRLIVQTLAEWFQYNELRQLQEGKAPPIYQQVKTAVLSAIHATDIRYIVRDNTLMVCHEGVGWQPFNQLSDGQLRIASIFCDLAMRCASLNSHLGAGCIAKTPGLVTIDELDLHLHPKWQQQVVGDLRRVFPLLQFIVTSHSPFLLQAAFEHGAVVDMATGQFVSPSDPSIEDIAESTMGLVLPQRGQRFQTMKAVAQQYYELLEKVPAASPDEKASIKQKLDDALIPYANDPAYAAFLQMHRAAAGV